jgi:hypothetical protein
MNCDTFCPGYKVLPRKTNRQWIGIGFLNKDKTKIKKTDIQIKLLKSFLLNAV